MNLWTLNQRIYEISMGFKISNCQFTFLEMTNLFGHGSINNRDPSLEGLALVYPWGDKFTRTSITHRVIEWWSDDKERWTHMDRTKKRCCFGKTISLLRCCSTPVLHNSNTPSQPYKCIAILLWPGREDQIFHIGIKPLLGVSYCSKKLPGCTSYWI